LWKLSSRPYNEKEDVGTVRLLRLEAALKDRPVVEHESAYFQNKDATITARNHAGQRVREFFQQPSGRSKT